MIDVSIFPEYYYKDKGKYERTVVKIPEKNSWEIGYFNKREKEDYYLFRWDGTQSSADSIITTMGKSGFNKTTEKRGT